jgi:predicted nucleotidyltransferase
MKRIFSIDIPKEIIEAFCKKHHIRKLSIFGSVLRQDFRSDSDIDVFVEFHSDNTPGLIKLVGIEIELSNLIGRKVDLKTPQDLSRYFRQEVLESAEVQYAEI